MASHALKIACATSSCLGTTDLLAHRWLHARDSMLSVESRHNKLFKQVQQCESLPGPGYTGTMEKAGGPGMATG